MSTKETLEDVLEIVSTPGRWIKGALHQFGLDEQGNRTESRHCIIGACVEADQQSMNYFKAIQTLCDAAGIENRVIGSGLHPLVQFNDAPETTQEDIILLVKKAIYNTEEEAK